MTEFTDRQVAALVKTLAESAALIERGNPQAALPGIKETLESHRDGLASTAQIADFDFTVTSGIHSAGLKRPLP